jgi:hypothetical protein
MIYTPSFITIGSGFQKLIGGGGGLIQIHTDSTAYFNFFKLKKIG